MKAHQQNAPLLIPITHVETTTGNLRKQKFGNIKQYSGKTEIGELKKH